MILCLYYVHYYCSCDAHWRNKSMIMMIINIIEVKRCGLRFLAYPVLYVH